ncbi:hypothetical protein EV385_5168 [Krasilnikovia cinnamomea]|uniref:Uncharacterized protein n=1 Tax=Krasilnikovia cinnamomea TaxID=349313 RepID=A0A4Q7ZQ86_9ACTN|nr:hypothetical protein [Krasilnikovia cinnamomea]RZU53260.1 hypothetical protein EV385_5168 [Krasilnikovia cinnamomea]
MSMNQERQQLNEALDVPVAELLASGDFTVEQEPQPATVVFSARMPGTWTDEIAAETARRGLKNPGQLIRALVREGLDRVAAGEAHDPQTVEALQHLDAVRRVLIKGSSRTAA